MAERKKILLIDDSTDNLQTLNGILSDEYDISFAANADQALDIISSMHDDISVILIDIVMHTMDGYSFLKKLSGVKEAAAIPVIVVSQQDSDEDEIKALSLGAYDFLVKPYRAAIVKQRIANVIKLRETVSFVSRAERDPLTSLYSRSAFFRHARNEINENPDKKFVMITMDIKSFKLINDIFGVDEGDKLLKYIADIIVKGAPKDALCARINGDVFVVFIKTDTEPVFTEADFEPMAAALKDYPLNINIAPKFGVYYVRRPKAAISVMCDHAKLARESIKEKHEALFACYDDSMRSTIMMEQEIVNDMWRALREEQFEVFFQPKCDLESGHIAGAEALVRWNHPKKGLMSPGQFIPLFERNGFITNLDMYVWDKVCSYLRGWMDDGLPVVPVSVNISRVDIYNPGLSDMLIGLLKKYSIPIEYLHLEITETAYTENPQQIIDTIDKLHKLGFSIEMDDFGSGYSSLNMLNELSLDILKLDMRFLQSHSEESRKKNILNFLVSLAKWLGLSVVAEGVETLEQVLFLRSMSCNMGQGYYFAKPLPKAEFEEMLRDNVSRDSHKSNVTVNLVKTEDIWNPLSQFSVIFNSYIGALCVVEVNGDFASLIRANERFFEVLGCSRDKLYSSEFNMLDSVCSDDRERVMQTIKAVCGDYCEVDNTSRWLITGKTKWLHIKAKALQSVDGRSLLLLSVDDITERKEIEQSLIDSRGEMVAQREFFAGIFQAAPYGMAQFDSSGKITIANNAMVRMLGFDSIQEFESEDRFFRDFIAPESREAIEGKFNDIISGNSGRFDSLEFGVTANSDRQMWIKCSVQSAKYNGKTIFQCAVIDVKEIKRDAYSVEEIKLRDPMTGLIRHKSFEESVSHILNQKKDDICAFMVIDLDDFKEINDIHGSVTGDEALCKFSDIIKSNLRSGDTVARLGGDEFAVFIDYGASEKVAFDRSREIYKAISAQVKKELGLTCSMGVSMSPNHGRSFNELYAGADMALYRAKSEGKGTLRFQGSGSI